MCELNTISHSSLILSQFLVCSSSSSLLFFLSHTFILVSEISQDLSSAQMISNIRDFKNQNLLKLLSLCKFNRLDKTKPY